MSHAPLAFFSYVHDDDAHDNGRLTRIRERLQGEISSQWGAKVEIFQDRDMRWGTAWKQCIENSLDTTAFLIPIVTPRYFNSQPCREELKRFADREDELGRKDLILPFYYLRAPVFEDAEKRHCDPLAELLASRQYIDWRRLRFEPESTPDFGKALMGAAEHIVEALHRSTAMSVPLTPIHSWTCAAISTQNAHAGEQSDSHKGGAALKEPATCVVDWMGRGDFTAISHAIEQAAPGTRILVRPGTYREGLKIDKVLEIQGDGRRDDIVIEANGKSAVQFEASAGRVDNLTLRQEGSGRFHCVHVIRGRLNLFDCDISSDSRACVAIQRGAIAELRRNIIHDGREFGIYIRPEGQGMIEENEIVRIVHGGIVTAEGATLVARRNRIRDGTQFGIMCARLCAHVMIEDNEIVGNALAGIVIARGADPVVRRNRIINGKGFGIAIFQEGRGTIEDNEVSGSASCGIFVNRSGCPSVRKNRISNNGGFGVEVALDGAGMFEENTLEKNAQGAKSLPKDSCDRVIWRNNVEK